MSYYFEGPVGPFAGRVELPARLYTGIISDLGGVASTCITYLLSLLE